MSAACRQACGRQMCRSCSQMYRNRSQMCRSRTVIRRTWVCRLRFQFVWRIQSIFSPAINLVKWLFRFRSRIMRVALSCKVVWYIGLEKFVIDDHDFIFGENNTTPNLTDSISICFEIEDFVVNLRKRKSRDYWCLPLGMMKSYV